jgi:hypothetical protein
MRQARRVAWYRFRATFARRWGGYLSVVLLIGLIGGTAMASIEAARRTQSSYPTFLASTNPSDLTVSIFAPGSGAATSSVLSEIAHLSDVKQVRAIEAPAFVPLAPDGAPRLSTLGSVTVLASLDGAFDDQDRPAVAQGRTANPDRPDEMVMTATAASVLGAHVGQVVPMGFYTTAQEDQPDFGAPSVAPRLRANVRLVGIVVFDNSVVQDDIDRAYGFVMLSPALLAEAVALSPAAGAPIGYALQLRHGASDVPAVEEQVRRLVPPGSVPQFHVTSRVVSEVELALKPESVALGGFGAIAALVCLVLGAQAISRQLRLVDADRAVMRALGAGPAQTVGDGLIGALGAALLGALLAGALTVALSPLFPLGPVRPFYPDGGIAFDWTVLGLGLVVLVSVLGAGAVLLCYRRAPHRAGGARQLTARGSSTARRAEAAGMPVAAVAGVRFALEPGQGRTAVPVRSALVGTVIAVAMVVATLTFASSLHTLVSHPALYGWNWDYALDPSNDVPPAAMRLLDHDPDVAASSGFDYNNVEIDDQTVPVLMARSPDEVVSPPILSGHGLEAPDQVVVGAATLAVLHRNVGDKVFVSYGSRADAPIYIPPTPVVIVGTATFPAVGYESLVADHTSMGTGAMFSEAIFPPAFQHAVGSRDPTSTARNWSSCGCGAASAPAPAEPTCNVSPTPATGFSPTTTTRAPRTTTWSSSASSARPRS